MTHICVSKLTIIGSDNGLSPGRRQAIIWTNVGLLLFRTLGTNFTEILGEIHSFSFSKMRLKMSSAKWRLFSLGLNELNPGENQQMQHTATWITGLPWSHIGTGISVWVNHCFSGYPTQTGREPSGKPHSTQKATKELPNRGSCSPSERWIACHHWNAYCLFICRIVWLSLK